MKQLPAFLILVLGAAPALADVAPSPPQRGVELGMTLIVIAVLAFAGFGAVRRRRGR